jgi:hypothetical protein
MSANWFDGLLVEIKFSVGPRVTIFRSNWVVDGTLRMSGHVGMTVDTQLAIEFPVLGSRCHLAYTFSSIRMLFG